MVNPMFQTFHRFLSDAISPFCAAAVLAVVSFTRKINLLIASDNQSVDIFSPTDDFLTPTGWSYSSFITRRSSSLLTIGIRLYGFSACLLILSNIVLLRFPPFIPFPFHFVVTYPDRLLRQLESKIDDSEFGKRGFPFTQNRQTAFLLL